MRAIATGDVARLKQVKGVGGKLAERLALELREKILTVGAGMGAAWAPGRGRRRRAATPASTAPVGPLGEVYGALVLLGYKPAEIEPLLEKMDAKQPVADNVRERAGGAAEADRRMARKKHEDDDEAGPTPERAVVAGRGRGRRARTRDEDAALRPRSFAEFVGQRKIADNLAVYVQAARKRGDALDHVLLSGPPGPRQDDARVPAGARDGDRGARDVGAGARAQGRPGGPADVARRAATCCSSTRSTACSR